MHEPGELVEDGSAFRPSAQSEVAVEQLLQHFGVCEE
jgi:hypothetical protein